MSELHHIVVPALLYNLTLCALATAFSWHVLTMASGWWKSRKAAKTRN